MIDIATVKFILADGVELLKFLALAALPAAVLAALLLWRLARRKSHNSK